MAKGKVIEINNEKRQIKLDKEKKRGWLQVGKSKFRDFNLENGLEIEYEIKGANLDIKSISKQSFYNNSKNNLKSKKEEVVKKVKDYPYNFVSLGKIENINRRKIEKGNLSGKIKCKLTNLTPIFTNGIKKEDSEKKGHYREDTLFENGKYILPASSIKGEIRNIVEVLTTSCIKNIEEERLEKRLDPKIASKDISFGLIRRFPTDETSGLIVEAARIRIHHDALINNREYSIKEGFYKLKVNSGIYNHIDDGEIPKKGKKAEKSIKDDKEFRKILENGSIEVVLWISSHIFNKKYEKILIPKKNGKSFTFTKAEYDDLIYLIEQREQRDEKDLYLKKNFIKDSVIEYNEPIIFKVEENKAINLAFSEIPRLRYKFSPYDLVPEAFRPCSCLDELCFACRLFGTTGNNKEKSSGVAYTGRVYFSDATVSKENVKLHNKYETLKSLGEPHPSLARFYLKNNESYDNKNSEIRGRKFYWHHEEKINVKNNDYLETIKAKKEKHNASFKFLEKGNEFSFKVNFKDLTDEELGVLIYALELEKGVLHKFGKAKALGFGSSKIEIDKILIEDNEKKYNSFLNPDKILDKQKYLDIAKEKYKITDENREEIKELKIILSEKNNLDFSKSPFPEESKFDKKINKEVYSTLNWFTVKENKNCILATIKEIGKKK